MIVTERVLVITENIKKNTQKNDIADMLYN